MTHAEALEKSADITIDITQLDTIYREFGEDKEIQSAIAVNLSQRVTLQDEAESKSKMVAELLKALANSSEMSVRWTVAKNKHTPIVTLKELSMDTINLVRALVATNPNTPTDILQRFFHDEKIVRDGLSGNPSTPYKYLSLLADDSDVMVRLRLAENPSSPEILLEKLAKDSASNVRQAAQSRLQRIKT